MCCSAMMTPLDQYKALQASNKAFSVVLEALALYFSFALQLRALSLGQRAIEGKRRLQQDKALQSFYKAV